MSDVDDGALLHIGRDLLQATGEDPDREGLQRRFADHWRECMEYGPGTAEMCCESVTAEVVVLSGMRVWCDIAIGSRARESVPGLSTCTRIAHQQAHRLQLQECLCRSIVDDIARITATEDVAVMARGEHLCMTMRGIRTHGLMTSSIMRGVFRTSSETRMEFFALVSKEGEPENEKKEGDI